MTGKAYKLIIFDLDGTLADRDSSDLLPGVREYFASCDPALKFAIASNQGGVGLRYWMEKEGFGDPGKYPTSDQVWERILQIRLQIAETGRAVLPYVCFAYQSHKSHKWSPLPPPEISYRGRKLLGEWNMAHRKPSPGMLLAAIKDAGVKPEEALMVGDDIDDQIAAYRALCAYAHPNEFFKREIK